MQPGAKWTAPTCNCWLVLPGRRAGRPCGAVHSQHLRLLRWQRPSPLVGAPPPGNIATAVCSPPPPHHTNHPLGALPVHAAYTLGKPLGPKANVTLQRGAVVEATPVKGNKPIGIVITTKSMSIRVARREPQGVSLAAANSSWPASIEHHQPHPTLVVTHNMGWVVPNQPHPPSYLHTLAVLLLRPASRMHTDQRLTCRMPMCLPAGTHGLGMQACIRCWSSLGIPNRGQVCMHVCMHAPECCAPTPPLCHAGVRALNPQYGNWLDVYITLRGPLQKPVQGVLGRTYNAQVARASQSVSAAGGTHSMLFAALTWMPSSGE